MSDRHYAFIPVVEPGRENAAQLIEVYAQPHASQGDGKEALKGLDPIAVPLRKVGLYSAGCSAVNAVRKLGLRRPWGAFYQAVRKDSWLDGQQLQLADRDGPTEGRSAELGLALALLMNASGTRHRCVFATGALVNDTQVDEGSGAATWRPDDVKVSPVGSVPEKLRLVIQQVRARGLPDLGGQREALFLTPTHFKDGGKQEAVKELPEVRELSQLGVRVMPVTWLGDAARAVNAHRSRLTVFDRLSQLVVGGGAMFALFWVGWLWWCHRPIPMEFLDAGPRAKSREPFLVCSKGGVDYPSPLRQTGITDEIGVSQLLGWRVKIGDPGSLPAKLGSWLGFQGYYVAQIMVPEFSRAKVIIPEQPHTSEVIRFRPGEVWEQGWQLNDRAETNGLVLLARRQGPFDDNELRRRLFERFPGAAGGDTNIVGIDVTAAVNFIKAEAPGAVKFVFQTVENGPGCAPNRP